MRGQYTIVRQLGKGGMGAVYLATQTLANRQRHVVVKEMLDYYDPSNPQEVQRANERFEAEAAMLASLNFAGIPQIFDFFSEGGSNYIVMQYIEGRNLQEGLTRVDEGGSLVQGRAYLPHKVQLWGVQITKVLERLAAQKVIHMDIKPANLILDRAGDIWLVDFGTAKAQKGGPGGGALGVQKSSIYGTQGYAPPEQDKGKPEPRSDVYALAATLYHLLTDDDPGDHPFQFPRVDKLSVEMAKALKKALELSPAQRPDAKHFRQLLETGASSLGGPPFRWRDGTMTHSPEELGATANRCWEEARGYFTGEQWEKWLTSLHQNQAVGQLQTLRAKYSNADVTLDLFLRDLDPTLPPARLLLAQPSLDAGIVPWQEARTLQFELKNAGGGCLYGRIRNLPSWVGVKSDHFATHDRQTITLQVNTTGLTPQPQPHVASLLLAAGASGQAQLAVSVRVPEPHLEPTSLVLEHPGRDEEVSGSLTLHNTGGSPCHVELESDADWLTLDKAILCKPGYTYTTVRANTSRLGVGWQRAQVRLKARANGWQQSERCEVSVDLPRLRTWWQRCAATLDWIAFGLLCTLLPFASIGWLLSYHWADIFLRPESTLAATLTMLGAAFLLLLNRNAALRFLAFVLLLCLTGLELGILAQTRVEFDLALTAALAALIGGLGAGLLHRPGKTGRYPWSGLVTIPLVALLVVGGEWLLVDPFHQVADAIWWVSQSWYFPGGSPRQILYGDEEAILLAATGADGLRLWRMEIDAPGGTFGDTGDISFSGNRLDETGASSVAFSPDGTLLAAGGGNGAVRLWWVADGSSYLTVMHDSGVVSVAFSPDGTRVAAAARSGNVWLWRVVGPIALLDTVNGYPVTSVAFSPDGRYLAMGLKDGSMRTWHIAGDSFAFVSPTDTGGAVRHLAFSPAGSYLVAGTQPGRLKLWDGGDQRYVWAGPWEMPIAFSPDGSLLAAGGDGGTVQLWHVADGTRVGILRGPSDIIAEELAFSPSGERLTVLYSDGTWRWWSRK